MTALPNDQRRSCSQLSRARLVFPFSSLGRHFAALSLFGLAARQIKHLTLWPPLCSNPGFVPACNHKDF
uniref:Uncharacterized protein n=1 Tax=Arundo donax TaxID=35708 RepID=A0A0A8Y3G0_ARUDO